MRKIKIVALYKHNIVYKNIKHYDIKTFVASSIFLLVALVSIFAINTGTVLSKSLRTANPINELYHDVQIATFVSGENLNFIVPVKSDDVENLNTSLRFKVGSSIMVIAPASGEVVEVGTAEQKYIKIKHGDNLFTIISGIKVCGVTKGSVVKQGKEIATATEGDTIEFVAIQNGKQVSGLYLYKSFIKWD